MIKRYTKEDIARLWTEENKFSGWQTTELAAIEARANRNEVSREIFERIRDTFLTHPISIKKIEELELVNDHDFNAFLEERLELLEESDQAHVHDGLTSYDGEENSFRERVQQSTVIVKQEIVNLEATLRTTALTYRFVLMLAHTHGQGAKLQSFGKRCLTWLVAVRLSAKNLFRTLGNLQFSKMSGAIGSWGDFGPELERDALALLGAVPFYGSTQIVPREIYAAVASALSQVVATAEKIAMDVRLGARSGSPIYHEPFKKKQKGSSAMPGKKNTIKSEQISGMAAMAAGNALTINRTVLTWEERAIEQSCIERVTWPDLFHIVVHTLRTLNKVLSGLVVYPDNMLREIVEMRGTYAAEEAKRFLKHKLLPHGIDSEQAYRIVQLAAFNVFEPSPARQNIRDLRPFSLGEAAATLYAYGDLQPELMESIQDLIPEGKLRVSAELEISQETVNHWNQLLFKQFLNRETLDEWHTLFSPAYLLRHEHVLYEKILGA